jgi:TonB family protein
LIATILLHAGIVLLLYYAVLRTVIPEELGGILVNFGTVNESTGYYEPSGGVPVESLQPVVPEEAPSEASEPEVIEPDPVIEEELIAQEEEESIAAPPPVKPKEKPRKEIAKKEPVKKKDTTKEREDRQRKLRELEEADRLEKERLEAIQTEKLRALAAQRATAEQREREQAIQNLGAGAFAGNGEVADASHGSSSSGRGNEGNPFGNSSSGVNQGSPGVGYSLKGLDGRGEGGVQSPKYTENEEGTIVIDIVVDPSGNVINADVVRGTSISDAAMRAKAVKAIRSAKFSRIDGTINQSGTITFRYKLK